MEKKIYTFCLPDIGEGIVEGEVVEWLKQPGERVNQDEPVVVVMTDKATVELPAPCPGLLRKQYYQPGEIALKDKPLYDIEREAETKAVESIESIPPANPISKPRANESKSKEQVKKSETKSNKAIPKVRHEAKEWGIDLDLISGEGKEGRVTEEDLHHAVSQTKAPPKAPVQERSNEQRLIGIRGLMAKRMHEVRIPQFSYFEQVDAARLMQLHRNLKEKAGQENINLSYMPFFIRALSITMKHFPQINASIDMSAGKIIYHANHHIGIAVATPQGLIVPVLKDVEAMGFSEIVHAYEELKSKILGGKLMANEMKGATVTLSNFGILEGEGLWATPMISDPEVAILATGRIRKAPIVKDEQIVIGSILPLSWSFDHRVIDGELAARVSHYYCALIKDPASLL